MSQLQGHLMVMAGGTGGHVFPALAVADALRKQNTQITWLGTHRGLEASVVPAHDINIEWISVEGLRGKGVFSWLLAPFKLLRAMWQSALVIKKVNPDCVLGMGGFVAGPGGLTARLMGRPLIVHEQNAVAGLTNKYLAKIATRVLTGFENVIDLPETAEWVGNPVRSSITTGVAAPNNSSPKNDKVINVLVLGGSQGALAFNQHLPEPLFSLSAELGDISVWHQTGRGNSQSVQLRYQSLNANTDDTNIDSKIKVTEFIDDMASAYQWADVLICRAGAMTIAECCAAAKPALLVPYPFSAGDHQTKNAQAMVDVGAAVMLDNDELGKPAGLSIINCLLKNKARLADMGNKAQSLVKPDALHNVVQVCQEYLHA